MQVIAASGALRIVELDDIQWAVQRRQKREWVSFLWFRTRAGMLTHLKELNADSSLIEAARRLPEFREVSE